MQIQQAAMEIRTTTPQKQVVDQAHQTITIKPTTHKETTTFKETTQGA